MSHLEPRRPNVTLWLGTGVHHGLNEYYRGNVVRPVDAFNSWALEQLSDIRKRVELSDEQHDKLLEVRVLGANMLDHYGTWAPKHDAGLTGLAEEHSFAVPLAGFAPTDAVLCGRWDRIVKDSKGLYWIMEHKTAQRFDTERLILDEQVGVYIYAAEKTLGLKTQGVLYNMLRKKAPFVPEPMASGVLTQRANLDTTYEVYRAAIDRYGLSPNDYTETLDRLKERGNAFFLREYVYRSATEIQLLMANIAATVTEMLDPKVILYPNPGTFSCLGCQFQGPCIAMADGSDWKFIIEQEFQTRKDRTPTVDVVEEPLF